MLTGRFINKLVDDRLEWFQTEGADRLLNETNMMEVWNLGKVKPQGSYFTTYPDDMAFTYTTLTYDYDSHGRRTINNDTVIVRFNGSDGELILKLLENTEHFSERMKAYQANYQNGFRNPLPDVTL